MSILLRPFNEQDIPAFTTAVNQSLDTLLPWLTWAHDHYTDEEARSWIAFTHAQRQSGEADEMGLFAEDGRLLGGAGLRFSKDNPAHCSIGYWVRSSEQKKGIATEAVRLLAAKAFADTKMDRLEILAAETNFASRAVASKAGAVLKEVCYGLIVLECGPVNTAVYHLHRHHTALS